jgi:putative colanic acid biosynthesis glycosyltransferase
MKHVSPQPVVPLFSVVTITWNNLAGLRETARSVMTQRDASYEWIVVDGASDDGTIEAFADGEFVGANFVSESDRGLYDAMNKGLERSRGEYVIFMNAGDGFADQNVLRDVANHGAFGQCEIIYGDAFEVDGAYAVFKKAFSHERVWYTMFAHHQSMFYARKAIQARAYSMRYPLAADWALTAALLRDGARASYIDRAICRFERGGLSQTNTPEMLRRWRQDRIRVYREVFGFTGLKAHAILTVKESVEATRRRFPKLYDRLRMSKASGLRGTKVASGLLPLLTFF